MTYIKYNYLNVGEDWTTTIDSCYAVYENREWVVKKAAKEKLEIDIKIGGEKICRIRIIGEPKKIEGEYLKASIKRHNWRPQQKGGSTEWTVYFHYDIVERY